MFFAPKFCRNLRPACFVISESCGGSGPPARAVGEMSVHAKANAPPDVRPRRSRVAITRRICTDQSRSVVDKREVVGIGLVSHQSLLYDQLTAAENLEFFARLYGVDDPRTRGAELLDTIGLGHRAADPVGMLSRGMQQRVSIARALVHDPPIVFLDEPFTGLDPHAAEMLRTTLDGLRTRGRTVLLVTHNRRQGLELSHRWLLLSRGRIIDQGNSEGADPAAFEREYFRRLGEDGARA